MIKIKPPRSALVSLKNTQAFRGGFCACIKLRVTTRIHPAYFSEIYVRDALVTPITRGSRRKLPSRRLARQTFSPKLWEWGSLYSDEAFHRAASLWGRMGKGNGSRHGCWFLLRIYFTPYFIRGQEDYGKKNIFRFFWSGNGVFKNNFKYLLTGNTLFGRIYLKNILNTLHGRWQ